MICIAVYNDKPSHTGRKQAAKCLVKRFDSVVCKVVQDGRCAVQLGSYIKTSRDLLQEYQSAQFLVNFLSPCSMQLSQYVTVSVRTRRPDSAWLFRRLKHEIMRIMSSFHADCAYHGVNALKAEKADLLIQLNNYKVPKDYLVRRVVK